MHTCQRTPPDTRIHNNNNNNNNSYVAVYMYMYIHTSIHIYIGEIEREALLQIKDLSPFANQYGILTVEWFVSDAVGEQTFPPHPAAEGRRFKVPTDAVGKYVRARATRHVEDQLAATRLRDREGGVYDQHVGGVRHNRQQVGDPIVPVVSEIVVGPVAITDEDSMQIMHALKKTSFGAVARIYLEPDEEEENPKRKKVPASVVVGFDKVTFRYSKEEAAGSTSWLAKLGAGKADEKAKKEETAMLQFTMQNISFRPSKSKLITLAVDDADCMKKTKVRIEPDPVVGRERMLLLLLAFQGAVAMKRSNLSEWRKAVEEADVAHGKEFVQDYLDVLTGLSTKKAAYHEVPATPWD
eukprot:GHVU01021727.1.p1 GENE.GHVU01021727.1~~GHVU01021727.1.p1  ORF type:complete len:354 (-),score=72.18 GHVU01021727.1:389-1450(-)